MMGAENCGDSAEASQGVCDPAYDSCLFESEKRPER